MISNNVSDPIKEINKLTEQNKTNQTNQNHTTPDTSNHTIKAH